MATIARRDVEEALRSDEPVDLLLDVERIAADGERRETGRLALGWKPEDLERLLAQAGGDEITLTFREGELQRLLNAAAALVAVGHGSGSLQDRMSTSLVEAARSVDSGAAADVLNRWVAASRS